MLDLTADTPRPAHRPPRPPAPTGGYTAVARLLNETFDWEASGKRPVRRQQVQAWHKYHVLNQAGQLPPSPVVTDPDPVHTYPTWIFDTTSGSEWIDWAAAGVPGPNGQGWVTPVRRSPAGAMPRWRQARVRIGDRISWDKPGEDRRHHGTVELIQGLELYARSGSHLWLVLPSWVTSHRRRS